MIRRDANSPGQPAVWLLIEQAEHARLAGAIAAAWGRPPFARLDPREPLLTAIAGHDDGWRGWDSAPDVAPSSGRARAFTEMPLHESLAIWRGSIAAADASGPLAAYVVAGHFCRLLRRFRAWRADPELLPFGRAFLKEFDRRIADWYEAWRAEAPERHTPQLAAAGVHALQFFDNLSLWLCCAERRETQTFLPRGGPHVTFTPVTTGTPAATGDPAGTGEPAGPIVITVRPWPLVADELELTATARRVPAGAYSDRAALAAAPSQAETLRWKLIREN